MTVAFACTHLTRRLLQSQPLPRRFLSLPCPCCVECLRILEQAGVLIGPVIARLLL